MSNSCDDMVPMGEKLAEKGDEARCGRSEGKSHLEKDMSENAEVPQKKQKLLEGEEVNRNENEAGIICQPYIGMSTHINFSNLRHCMSLLNQHLGHAN